MTDIEDVDYGPLAGLIGSWKGERGLDIAPEPDGTERNPFYETITFEAAGDVENAEEQHLAIVRYHQKVFRSSNDKQFHDQVGYWTWEKATGSLSNSFVIPRRVSVVAGGAQLPGENGEVVLSVEAAADGSDWEIGQSPFMKEKARTVSFTQVLTLDGDSLSYKETTVLDIYGRKFDHIDSSRLIRV